ncbi:MAG: hypothetical protein WKF30_00250 [Pyrinomonadaceae bacterium]
MTLDRLGEPVTIQSYYDKTAEVAQWNVYEGTPAFREIQVKRLAASSPSPMARRWWRCWQTT